MTLPDLAAWLRRHRADDAVLELDRPAVASLLQELRRLQQSGDRMRRQNRKLRQRIAGRGADALEDGPVGDGNGEH